MQETTNSQVTPNRAGSADGRANSVWRLHVVACPDRRWAGRVVVLANATCNLGRDVRGPHDLAIGDGALSRHHATLQVGASSVQLRDNHSRNGSFVAGRRLKQAVLGHGAVLRFGDTCAVLESDSGDANQFDQPTANVPGQSELARRARSALDMAARDMRPTLICGETGTGKEFAVAELHLRAGRFGKLVRVNVAAIPDALFEAQLFGHAKGAFTGAGAALLGFVREADGGTLVLDEIGELALALQAKLLRLFDSSTVRPVGSPGEAPVAVRYICTSNADLQAPAKSGHFRVDLLGRLQPHRVYMPPLSARLADLLALADAVAPPAGAGRSWATLLDARSVERLLLTQYPFNIRSLQAILATAYARMADGLSPDAALDRSLAELSLPSDAEAAAALPNSVQHAGATQRYTSLPAADFAQDPAGLGRPQRPDFPSGSAAMLPTAPPVSALAPPAAQRWRPEPEMLRGLLGEHRGNIDHIAQALGRDRRQVYRWLHYAGIGEADLRGYRAADP